MITSVGRGEGKTHLATMLRTELSFIARQPYQVLHWRQLRGLEPAAEPGTVVLVDGPALLEGEEVFSVPPAWMEAFGGSLVVVLKRSTPRPELAEAVAWLSAAGAPPLGLIWNERDFPNYWTVAGRIRDRLARLVDRRQRLRSFAAPPPTSLNAAGEVTMSFAWRGEGRFTPAPGADVDEPTVRLSGAAALGRLAATRASVESVGTATDSGFQWRRGDALSGQGTPGQPTGMAADDATVPAIEAASPPAEPEAGRRKRGRKRGKPTGPLPQPVERDTAPGEGGVAEDARAGITERRAAVERPPASLRGRSDRIVALITMLVLAAGMVGAALFLSRPDPNDALFDARDGGARLVDGAPTEDALDATPLLPMGAGAPAAPIGMVTLPAGEVQVGLPPRQRVLALARRRLDMTAAAQAARCEDTFAAEAPGPPVAVEAIAIGRTEVSQEAYGRCVAAGACEVPRTMWDRGDRPVSGVTQAMASAYCAWRGGRLPRVAEWRYGARGTDDRLYPWGDAAPVGRAALRANHGGAHLSGGSPDLSDGEMQAGPVESCETGRSPFGLLNMAGNVREWTEEVVGGHAAVLGGGFNDPPFALRVTGGTKLPIELYAADLGFRCVVPVGAARMDAGPTGAGRSDAGADAGTPSSADGGATPADGSAP